MLSAPPTPSLNSYQEYNLNNRNLIDIFYVALKVVKKREQASHHGILYWENSLESWNFVKA